MTPPDPGWRPAAGLAVRIAMLRTPSGSILEVMRAASLFLAVVSAAAAVGVLILGGGSREPRIEDITAQIGLFVAVGAAAAAIAAIGREGPDTTSEPHLASWVFRTTMRRVLAAAAVGPVGLILSWAAGDGAWVIYGTGASLLLLLVAAPTSRRLTAWEDDVEEDGLSVMAAVLRPYG